MWCVTKRWWCDPLSDYGARSVSHGELLQDTKCAWPWLPVPHQSAIQHRFQRVRRTTRHDDCWKLDNRCGSESGPSSWGGLWAVTVLKTLSPSNILEGRTICSVLLQVRRINLYMEGEKTPYNQILHGLTLDRCWNECLSQSRYEEKRAAADFFNK